MDKLPQPQQDDDECLRIEAEGARQGDELIKDIELKKLRKETEQLKSEIARFKEKEEQLRQGKEKAEGQANALSTQLEQQQNEYEQKLAAVAQEYENAKAVSESLKEAGSGSCAPAPTALSSEKTFDESFEWLTDHYERMIGELRSDYATLKAEHEQQQKTIEETQKKTQQTQSAQPTQQLPLTQHSCSERSLSEEELDALTSQNAELLRKYEECKAENDLLKRRCGDLEIQVGHKLSKIDEAMQAASVVPRELKQFESAADLWANNRKLVEIVGSLEREIKHAKMVKDERATLDALRQINVLKDLHKRQLEKLSEVAKERNDLRTVLKSKLLSISDKDVRETVSAAQAGEVSPEKSGISTLFDSLNEIRNDFEDSKRRILDESKELKEENIELKKKVHELEHELESSSKTAMDVEDDDGDSGHRKMNGDVEESIKKVALLEAQISHADELNRKNEEKIAQLQEENRKMGEESAALSAERRAAAEESSALKRQVEELAEQNRKLTESSIAEGKSFWSKELIDKSEELRKTQEDIIAGAESRIKSMTAENERTVLNLETEIRKLKDAVEGKSRVLTERELEVLRLRGDIKELQEQLRVVNAAQRSEAAKGKQLEERNAELTNLNLICTTDREENLTKELSDMKITCDGLRERIATEAERNKVLSQKNEFAISEQRNLAAMLKAANADLDAKNRLIGESARKASELEGRNGAAQEEIRRLEAQARAYKEAADSNAAKAARGEAAAREASEKASALERRLQECTEKVSMFDALKKEYDALRDSCETLKGVQAENASLSEAKAALEADIAALRAEMEETKKMKDNYLILYNHSAQKNRLLEDELAHVGHEAAPSAENGGADKEQKSFNVILNSLTQEKVYLENLNEKLKTRVGELEKDCAELGETLKRTTETKDGKIGQLEESLSVSNTTLNELRTKSEKDLAESKMDCASLAESLEETKGKLDITEKELNEIKEKYAGSNKSLEEATGKLSGTEKELNEIKSKYADAAKNLEETKGKLDNTEKELNEIKEKYADSNKTLEETKGKLGTTEKELNEVKSKYADAAKSLEETKGKLSATEKDLNDFKSKVFAMSKVVSQPKMAAQMNNNKRRFEGSTAEPPAEKRPKQGPVFQSIFKPSSLSVPAPVSVPVSVPEGQANAPEHHWDIPPSLPQSTVQETQQSTLDSTVEPDQHNMPDENIEPTEISMPSEEKEEEEERKGNEEEEEEGINEDGNEEVNEEEEKEEEEQEDNNNNNNEEREINNENDNNEGDNESEEQHSQQLFTVSGNEGFSIFDKPGNGLFGIFDHGKTDNSTSIFSSGFGQNQGGSAFDSIFSHEEEGTNKVDGDEHMNSPTSFNGDGNNDFFSFGNDSVPQHSIFGDNFNISQNQEQDQDQHK